MSLRARGANADVRPTNLGVRLLCLHREYRPYDVVRLRWDAPGVGATDLSEVLELEPFHPQFLGTEVLHQLCAHVFVIHGVHGGDGRVAALLVERPLEQYLDLSRSMAAPLYRPTRPGASCATCWAEASGTWQ